MIWQFAFNAFLKHLNEKLTHSGLLLKFSFIALKSCIKFTFVSRLKHLGKQLRSTNLIRRYRLLPIWFCVLSDSKASQLDDQSIVIKRGDVTLAC